MTNDAFLWWKSPFLSNTRKVDHAIVLLSIVVLTAIIGGWL